ncbi:ATP-dependent RNA helicase SrmB [Flocculibacter collagenilyticus]|uniref:ATP-dependent RNA helicase SrmB n=1 Tax=Flocculibacter collagenilyticus TaxID=2744479 RepID=UPI0018F494EF|nr:ATP-dependent RNA helicase SrmB [Flocculibacter collagenilyticus]
MTFDELDLAPELLKAVKNIGYKKPTTIQQETIPAALEGNDILACSPTGTGKTVAFLLPALQHLLDFPRRNPGFARVLIMAPTRELAYQIHEQATLLAANTHLKLGVITGGINYGSHKEIFEKNNDLLVATPGRLMEYLETENFHAEDVEILVIDEADRMLDMGFRGEMQRITDEARNRRHAMLFSATLESNAVEKFADQVLNDPIGIMAEPPKSETGKITQWIHLADDAHHKFALLVNILKQEETHKAIVFVKTRERLQTLIGQLQSEDVRCNWLQGEMPQDKRLKAIEKFQNGWVKVLVATDVAARGIDIDDITHVINYDMPRSADVYVHRIGRTARAGKKGTAISLIEAHDVRMVAKVERFTDQKLKRRVIEGLKPRYKEARIVKKKKVKGKAAKKVKLKKKK